ncbi:ProQ [Legionella geestiana]|uniref:ProQ n=1 Tax=Legionella geestiana TaxID=45065 RepID=A0A0W0TPY3_9GAMM|nr:ProQ/FinO family protein [Legionella geestiana]KTC97333.1 ProQ [Legionella geestiana]QBS12458.1 activator of prop osmoprotectant transporter [Legionella geestiana]STX55099.1 ProQ [Legionella geestiana]
MRRQELHPRTAVINRAQKLQSKKARVDALSWLAARFPEAFDNTSRIRPLKQGIMEDILATVADEAEAAGISKSKLREAVVVFTRRVDYLTCLKAREMRIDLQGSPAGLVTEEEAERAAVKIRKRVEKSARNARRNNLVKMQAFNPSRAGSGMPVMADDSALPERAPAWSAPATPAARAPSVVVRHKSTRAFDPDAVARLKAKLGLSTRADAPEEEEAHG